MPKDRLYAAAKREPTQNLSKATRSTTLPPQLQRSVPQCAQQCLLHYINQEYNCPDNELACLCDRYSSEGFTLGELAYICLTQTCQHESTAEQKKAYFVCNSNSQAVGPTHATLTLPASTASRIHTSIGSLHTATGTSKHTRPHTASSVATMTKTALSAAMGPSRTQTMPASAAAQASRATSTSLHATGLTGAQAAGISIAAMGTVILAIALIYLISCLRRRKVTIQDERKTYDFVDEAPPRFSPFNYGIADPRGPLGGFQKRRAELVAETRTSNWARSHYAPDNTQRHEKGVDISPATYQSHDSKRSQLLPDKPYSTLLRPFQKSPALTTMTIFEEDRPQERPPPVPSLKPLPKLPPAGRAIYYPAPPPVKPRRNPQYVDQSPRSPDKTRQPSLSLDIPRQAARLPRIPSPVAFPLPPNVAPPLRKGRDPSTESKSKSRGSEGSLLNYYASPEAGCDASPDIDEPTTPIDEEIQRRKAVPNSITITKPTHPPRAVRMDSNGSDTSFESNATDEPTPPEEIERQLTPVQEPGQPSPISCIRYPKIPRSSNQAVPRSPGPGLSPGPKLSALHVRRIEVHTQQGRPVQPTQQRQQGREKAPPDPITPQRQGTTSSTLSGSTLAAKRLGSNAAQNLERGLYLTDSTHSRANSNATTKFTKSEPNSGKSLHHPGERNSKAESPLKGYGRVASGGRRVSRGQIGPEMKTPGSQLWRSPGLPGQPQEVTLKSPLWEPKLTPSRKGDDLYLSVGVATPMTSTFTPIDDRFAH